MKKKLTTILAILTLLLVSSSAMAQVTVSETKTTIPTYLVGDPGLDPYFFTGRTYQGKNPVLKARAGFSKKT